MLLVCLSSVGGPEAVDTAGMRQCWRLRWEEGAGTTSYGVRWAAARRLAFKRDVSIQQVFVY